MESNGIGGRAVKSTNPRLVLWPAKEEFELPAVLAQSGDGAGTAGPLISPECETAREIKVVETDATQESRLMVRSVAAVESNRLVGTQVDGSVNRLRSHNVVTKVVAIPNHEECATSDR